MLVKFIKPSIVMIEILLICIIVFYSTFVFCLPISNSIHVSNFYPELFVKISFKNVLLHEFLFIIWLTFFSYKHFSNLKKLENDITNISILIMVLAIWCGLTSITFEDNIIQDTGRTFRLILNSLMFLSVIIWVKSFNNLILICAILGLIFGLQFNLISSLLLPNVLQAPHGYITLHGQNTVGVWAGLGVHLSGWTYIINKKLRVLSVFLFIISFLCSILSYSKIGWLICFCGLIIWVQIIFTLCKNVNRNLLYKLVVLTLMILVTFSYIFISEIVEYISQKSWFGISFIYRLNYIYASFEIIQKNFFGVGYAGFYDALLATDIKKFGTLPNEYNSISWNSRQQANPHSSFLWYLIAGGYIGLFLSLLVFCYLGYVFKKASINIFEKYSMIVSTTLIFSMFIVANTVPYIYNSLIYILPVALVLGMQNKKIKNERILYSF